MKSKFLKTYAVNKSGRLYPHLYSILLSKEDNLTDEIIEGFPLDTYTEGGRLLSPSQVEWLIRVANDIHLDKGEKRVKFQWYKYDFQEFYPMVILDDTSIINFMDIPVVITDTGIMGVDEKSQYISYLNNISSEFATYYPDINIETNWIAYDLFAMDYNCVLPAYPVSSKSIKSFDSDSYNLELIKRSEEREESLRLANEEANKRVEEVLPFEYDRSLDRLIIPKNVKPTDFRLTKQLMEDIQDDYGLNMSLSKLRELKVNVYRSSNALEKKLSEELDLNSLNIKARKYSEDHPAVRLLNKIGQNPYRFRKKNKSGNYSISFTKPDRESLLSEVIRQYGENSKQVELLRDYGQYSDLTNGILQTGKPIFQLVSGYEDPTIKSRIDEENDTITFNCGLKIVKTCRLTTNSPNIQGQTKEIKTCIVGSNPKRKIMSLDIKAQEVMILIFGVLENQKLKSLVLQNKDPYKSFAICAGLCTEDTFTQELKDLVKVPVLSIMNGKSEWNIKKEMEGNERTAQTILDLITKDPGYEKIVKVAREEEKKSKGSYSYGVVRRGLFGTARSDDPSEKSGSPYTQSLNSNFQVTASEILSYGLNCLIIDLKTGNNRHGLTLDQLTPVVPIYDEVVFEYDEDVEDEVEDLVNFYICPQVSGWLEMTGEVTKGRSYIYKD